MDRNYIYKSFLGQHCYDVTFLLFGVPRNLVLLTQLNKLRDSFGLEVVSHQQECLGLFPDFQSQCRKILRSEQSFFLFFGDFPSKIDFLRGKQKNTKDI